MAQDAQQELFQFLDRRVFQPIMNASPGRYSGDDDKQKLADVKDRTRREKERYQNYEDAQKLRSMYLDDVQQSSGAAERTNDELKELGLPRLEDVRDEFMSLCDRLGVH